MTQLKSRLVLALVLSVFSPAFAAGKSDKKNDKKNDEHAKIWLWKNTESKSVKMFSMGAGSQMLECFFDKEKDEKNKIFKTIKDCERIETEKKHGFQCGPNRYLIEGTKAVQVDKDGKEIFSYVEADKASLKLFEKCKNGDSTW